MSKQSGFMITIMTDNEWKVDVYSSDNVRKNIGGLMEVFYRFQLNGNDYDVICNDSGLLMSLPENLIGSCLYGDGIVGNIVIVKVGLVDGEPDFIGMSLDEVQKVKEWVFLKCMEFIMEAGDNDNES